MKMGSEMGARSPQAASDGNTAEKALSRSLQGSMSDSRTVLMKSFCLGTLARQN